VEATTHRIPRRVLAGLSALTLATTPTLASTSTPPAPARELEAAPVAAAPVPADPADRAALVAERRAEASRDYARTQVPAASPPAAKDKPTHRRAAPVRARAAVPVPPPSHRAGDLPPRRTVPSPSPHRSSGRVATVIAFARAQVGKPYRWGAAGPNAYDCSGLVMAAFARIGIRLPHQSGGIAHYGQPVPLAQAKPGDVAVYSGHVALILGGGMMLEAPHAGTDVRVTRLRRPSAVRRLA
jgi:peptidoglycan DL-endopeptidase CwlO